MRKGLTVTLLTVAIAILGSNAMSMAPVVEGIRDIIVADDTPVSGANRFVYPDAINLNNHVSDGDTPLADLNWSYVEDTGTYVINAAPSLIPGTDDPLSPPAAKIIVGPGATTGGDPEDIDGELFTITVRNQNLSPIGQPDGGEPGPAGILPSETRVLTFYATDGEAEVAGSQDIMVYTYNDGVDSLSPSDPFETIGSFNFAAGQHGWVFFNQSNTSSSTSGGLCMTVPGPGANIGRWDSPYGFVELVDNAVWRFRLDMTSTVTNVSATPLWDFIVANVQFQANDPGFGANAYGADYAFLDNLGGSQGIGLPEGRNDFHLYFTPPPVTFTNWRSATTGAFQPAADAFNDMTLSFRVFDLDNANGGGWTGENDAGTLCLTQLRVDRTSLDSMNRGNVAYSNSNFQAGDWQLTQTDAAPAHALLTVSNGNLVVSRNNARADAWDSNIDILTPAENGFGSSYVLPWPADTLYLLEVEVSAPSAADAADQPDLFITMLEAQSVELYASGFVLPNVKFLGAGATGAGAPPVGSTDTYKAFGYTHNASVAQAPLNTLRPRFDIFNALDLGVAGARPAGSLTIHSYTVTEVNF